jgi:hypothetical protein
MNKLLLKDIFFGKTDAKNEFAQDSEEERNTFMRGFLLPDVIDLDAFRLGKRYYITGLKGTGKTALMRYISLYLEREHGSNTHFFLFKEKMTENTKAKLTRGSDWISIKSGRDPDQKDYVAIWEWFIFRKIVEICEANDIELFKDDKNWSRFVAIVKAADLDEKDKNRLIPNLLKGSISVKTPVVETSLDAEVGMSDNDNTKKKIKFVEYIDQVMELYEKLTPGEKDLYFFIDEVELSYGEKKQYQKDIWMIRDLVLAIDAVNRIARTHRYKLFIITGLRSEVLDSTKSAGKEINKPVEDFGVNLMWQQSGAKEEHPLIKIIHKRLLAAELALPENDRASEKEIWNKYFPPTINDVSTQDYILKKTWYRPRDIVRLLNIAKEQNPQANSFTRSMFDRINKDYSSKSWTEQSEELQATYTTEEIEGIKRILSGIKCPFNRGSITAKADEAKNMYSSVSELLSKYRLIDILTHLYKVGIIGNTGDTVRFAFRGDPDLILEQDMKIHDALWNFLSVTKVKQK